MPRKRPDLAAARSQVIAAIVGLFDALERSLAAEASPVLVQVPLPARAVRRLVARGELAARKIGRGWYAEPSAIRALLPARREQLPEAGPIANDEPTEPVDGARVLLDRILAEEGLELAEPPPSRSAGGRRSR